VNEEKFFLELREKFLLNSASITLRLIIDGRVVTGVPTGAEGFVDRANAIIEEHGAGLDEADPMKASIAGLRLDPPSEENLMSNYFTLRNAVLQEGVMEIELGLIRIDLSKVTAWGVVPPAGS
jgi:hypothetical protein